MTTIQANNYITLANVNKTDSWERLLEAVNAAVAASDEPICVNFAFVQLAEPNEYTAELLKNDKVIIECIKGNPTYAVFATAATVLLHSNEKIKNKFKFMTLAAPKTLTKKELDVKKRIDTYKVAINTVLDSKGPGRTSVFVQFSDIIKGCGLNNLSNTAKNLAEYFDTLRDICFERGIKEIMISMRDVTYHANLIDASLISAIRIFNEKGMKITFTDCNEELNGKLRIHIKLTYNNGSAEDVHNFVNELGVGRVVLLTKLKDHDSEDLNTYRVKDEVVAQFIAIIRQISADSVEFKYTGFAAMKTFHDLLAQYGSPDEFEDKLLMHHVTIPMSDLGCTDIRITKGWHLNLLNGDVEGSDEFNYISTYTSETIKALPQPEDVVLPEFIRRSLRSWHEPFNEMAMCVDVQNFKKKCKRKR